MYQKRQKWLRVSRWVYGIGIALFLIAVAILAAGMFGGWDTVSTAVMVVLMVGAFLILADTLVLSVLELREEILAKPKRALLQLAGEIAGLFALYVIFFLVEHYVINIMDGFSWGQALSWCLIVLGVDKSLTYYRRYQVDKKEK